MLRYFFKTYKFTKELRREIYNEIRKHKKDLVITPELLKDFFFEVKNESKKT